MKLRECNVKGRVAVSKESVDYAKESLEMRITVARKELQEARENHDFLQAELLEEALNDLLERYHDVLHV